MTLSLLTYNIRFGGVGRERLLMQVLEQQRADLIVLQEVTRTRVIEQLAHELGMEWVAPNGHYRQRVAVLSRFPLQSHKGYSLFPAECNILRVEVEHRPGDSLWLFGLHLTASSHLAPMEAVRLLQARFLSRLVRKGHGIKILAGDMNAVAHGDPVDIHRLPVHYKSLIKLQGGGYRHWAIPKIERSGFVDAFRSLHPDAPGHTLPAPRPTIRLDYVFVQKGMEERIRKCEPVLTPAAVKRASDHLPVWMEIDLD